MNKESEQKWESLCLRFETSGYNSLTEDEKLWINIRNLIDSIENGGLISYFYNTGADNLTDALEALDRLEASAVKERVFRVSQLFPQPVPRDLEERNEVIGLWPDDEDSAQNRLLEEIDEELFPLLQDLEKRLARHLAERKLGC